MLAMMVAIAVGSASRAGAGVPLPETVAVGLAAAQPNLTLRLPAGTVLSIPTGAAWQYEAECTLTCTVGPDGGVVAGATNYGRGPLRLTSANGLLGWGARLYRGALIVAATSRGLTLVNEIRLEDYLRGVVPVEVSADWPLEVLKAQAVAARTFAAGRLGYHRRDGYDLCATTDCQVYAGASAEKPATDQAVSATAGQVLVFGGRLASANYHSASGGHTEDVESVWPTATPVAYLRGVPDPAESSPYGRWRVEYDWASVEAAVAAKYPDLGRVLAIDVLSRTEAGRAAQVELTGEKGRKRITGEALRTLFSPPLRSSLCELSTEYAPVPISRAEALAGASVPHVFAPSAASLWYPIQDEDWILAPVRLIVNGRGWGHGVGMSQWGAKSLAELGYTYTMILEYYYGGAKVEDRRPPQSAPPTPTNGEVAG